MNELIGHILRTLALPAQQASDILHLTSVGIVQQSVALAALILTGALATIFFAAWFERRKALFAAAFLVSITAGLLITYVTNYYRSAWVYSVIICILAADVTWRMSRTKILRILMGTWFLAAIVIVGGIAIGGTLTEYFHANKTTAALSQNTADTQAKIATYQKSVASTLKSATTSEDIIRLATEPNPTVSELTAVQQEFDLDFLSLRTLTGAVLVETSRIPHPLVSGTSDLAQLSTDERGVPTATSTSLIQLSSGNITLSGGSFLDSARLTKLGVHGALASHFGVESSSGLKGDELLAVTADDTRTQFQANTSAQFYTFTSTGRAYLSGQPLDGDTNLIVVSVSTDSSYAVWQRGIIAGEVVLIALKCLAFLLFHRKQRVKKTVLIFSALTLVLLGAGTTWAREKTEIATGYTATTIRLDRPAVTPHIYFRTVTSGLQVQIDMAGANVAQLSVAIQLPGNLPANTVTLDSTFCTRIDSQPAVSSRNILTFTCSTSNPPLKGQGGVVATITAPASFFATGQVSLISGTAQARTDGANQTVPVRADPLVPAQ